MERSKIIPANRAHIDYVVAHLRPSDEAEILAAGGLSARDVFEHVDGKVWAAIDGKGVPFFIFGVSYSVDAQGLKFGIPWLVGTDKMEDHKDFIKKNTKPYIDVMKKGVAYLTNIVLEDNKRSIKWLCWAGFKLDGVIKLNRNFRLFHMRGEM